MKPLRDFRHAVGLALLLSAGLAPQASAIPFDFGDKSWTARAQGAAVAGVEDPNTGAILNALGGLLYIKWNPEEMGFVRAEWPQALGGVFIERKMTVTNNGAFAIGVANLVYNIGLTYTGNLGLIDPGCQPPDCRETAAINADINLGEIQIIVPDIDIARTNKAEVNVRAEANGDVQEDTDTDGPNADAPASAETVRQADEDGVPISESTLDKHAWGFFADHFVRVGDGPDMLIKSSEFTKDRHNNYGNTFDLLVSDFPFQDGQLPPEEFNIVGASFFDVFVDLDIPVGQSVMLTFTDRFHGFLEHEIDGIKVPEPSALALLAMGLAGLGFSLRRRNPSS